MPSSPAGSALALAEKLLYHEEGVIVVEVGRQNLIRRSPGEQQETRKRIVSILRCRWMRLCHWSVRLIESVGCMVGAAVDVVDVELADKSLELELLSILE